MGKKKKNYHKKNRNQNRVEGDVKEKSSLNLYILVGMTVVSAVAIIYFSTI